jgi:DNA-binding cell septation regulator SpoVG
MKIKMDIRVIDIRLSPIRGKPIRAFVDVLFGGLVLRDFRVMQDNGGKPYVKAPFTTYKDKTGRLKFRQLIALPPNLRGQVDVTILDAFYRQEKERQDDKPNSK